MVRRLGLGALALVLGGVMGGLLGGCPSEGPTVTLLVYTDFEVGEQFQLARYTFVPDGGGPATLTGELPADAFAPGTGSTLPRATTGRLPFSPSPQRYRVELVDASGAVVASVTEGSSFVGRERYEVTLWITRSDCEGVGPCADGESCLCGACYPIGCRTDRVASGCPGRCCGAVGCDAPLADCAEVVCIDDLQCAWVPREAACAPGDWCDGRSGCVPREDLVDAGTDAGVLDASLADAPSIDAWVDDTSVDAWMPSIDAWAADASAVDAWAVDASAPDGWAPDARAIDASSPDAPIDTGTARLSDGGRDAGPADAGRDASGDAGLCGGARCAADEECCAGRCEAVGCDDGNECTDDWCGATGCSHLPSSRTCTDDGNPCTNDVCSARVCTHPARTGSACSDGSLCTTGDACSVAGVCTGTPLDCADMNVCTSDSCNPATGCVHAPAMMGTACSDGDACTVGDTCVGTACQAGTPMSCNDSNPCTSDACVGGSCTHGVPCASFPVGEPHWFAAAACCDPGPAGGGDQYCADPNYDVANCGACGVACGMGEWCAPGTGGGSIPRCRCGAAANPSGPACWMGTTPACCSDTCVDLANDPAHCGVCGRACGGATPNCVSGSCHA
ncbi:MAG: hypothetical protein K1X94_02570 [Sandaracinaceae bacterium]|nr:hypothetical protein [Sandaracinaceae bacterium]